MEQEQKEVNKFVLIDETGRVYMRQGFLSVNYSMHDDGKEIRIIVKNKHGKLSSNADKFLNFFVTNNLAKPFTPRRAPKMKTVFFYFIAILTMLCVSLASVEAHAHSWYDNDCCNDHDCGPVIASTRDEALKGDWMTTKKGKVFVPFNYNKTRPSQDENTHVCMLLDSENPASAPTLLCVYRPADV